MGGPRWHARKREKVRGTKLETVRQAAERLGLKSWDGALPQPWANRMHAKFGAWPMGVIVWCYDHATIFGEPIALTSDGEIFTRDFAENGYGK